MDVRVFLAFHKVNILYSALLKKWKGWNLHYHKMEGNSQMSWEVVNVFEFKTLEKEKRHKKKERFSNGK